MTWTTRAMASMGLAVWCAALPARAQAPQAGGSIPDATVADAAHHKVELENEYVRVVRYVVPPHEKLPMHSHPSLVNVALTDVNARSTSPDGKSSDVHGKAGAAAWRGPSAHTYENLADVPIEGILVEPKKPGSASWTPPPNDAMKVDPGHRKVEFENDQVRIERYWYPKGERSAMHDHPAHVQIALTDSNARATAPDGKVTEIHNKAGQARYRPALSHAVENLGDRFEGILVVLKDAPAAPAR